MDTPEPETVLAQLRAERDEATARLAALEAAIASFEALARTQPVKREWLARRLDGSVINLGDRP